MARSNPDLVIRRRRTSWTQFDWGTFRNCVSREGGGKLQQLNGWQARFRPNSVPKPLSCTNLTIDQHHEIGALCSATRVHYWHDQRKRMKVSDFHSEGARRSCSRPPLRQVNSEPMVANPFPDEIRSSSTPLRNDCRCDDHLLSAVVLSCSLSDTL